MIDEIIPLRKEAVVVVIHESAEDYLESILILHQRLGMVRSIDIVNELGYSKPSVSIAMKKLRESGYITMAADGTITLNESGMEIALRVYGRHKAITRLFELLGVSSEQAAVDACKVEHDLSDETFRCIREFIEKQEQK
jgi:Mn-dependent DtxR family transcriptional regulator